MWPRPGLIVRRRRGSGEPGFVIRTGMDLCFDFCSLRFTPPRHPQLFFFAHQGSGNSFALEVCLSSRELTVVPTGRRSYSFSSARFVQSVRNPCWWSVRLYQGYQSRKNSNKNLLKRKKTTTACIRRRATKPGSHLHNATPGHGATPNVITSQEMQSFLNCLKM